MGAPPALPVHKIQIPGFVVDNIRRNRSSLGAVKEVDPARVAVLVIDMQRGWVDDDGVCSIPTAQGIIPAINRLIDAARAAGSKIVFTQHTWTDWPFYYETYYQPTWTDRAKTETKPGAEGFDLRPDLHARPEDAKVTKTRPSALIQGSSNLDDILRESGIDTVVITGALTNACCESTARDAAALGYRVLFAADATATRTDFEHNAALVNLMQFVADVRHTEEIVQLLNKEEADDPQWDVV